MHRIGACLPDLVQAVVAAIERAQVLQVALAGDGADGQQVDFIAPAFRQLDPGEPEAAVAHFHAAQPGHGQFEVPDSMVVGGRAPRRVPSAQGLGDGLAQDNPETDFVLGPAQGADQLDSALDLLPEIQQHVPTLPEGSYFRLVGGNLPYIGLQEVFRILHSPGHTNDAGRRQIFRHKARILRTRGFDRAAAGGHAQGEKG